ncbi:SigE family RNA polymerase sigma factor [uncultured Jatrophihabitans sp.]|uniref:SigE family RNA polymerase sigma factor n=1 Tax=uncultured Jatrophihabitans sp. TaxID=1610747 RepID=UPI0035CB18B4
MDVAPQFAEFVRTHSAALLRTAYLLTGDAVAAEELTQDTLARMAPKWRLVQEADLPLAYVRRALANAYADERRRSRRRPTESWHAVGDAAVARDFVGQMADRDALWASLRQLPPRQRAAIVLRYFDDLADDDIGHALACRPGTVRSLISRGLTAMRESSASEALRERDA